MRKIIHNKFPLTQDGLQVLTSEQQFNIHQTIKKALNKEEYIVISTPTDLTLVEGDTTIITIDAREYTYDELITIIRCHESYKHR